MTKTTQAVKVAPLVTKLHAEQDLAASAFTPTLVKLMMAGLDFPGYWTAEIIAPERPDLRDWLLVQRFRTAEQTTAWKDSEVRRQLLAELQPHTGGKGLTLTDEVPDLVAQSSVAAAIVTDVKHGMRDAYRTWETKAQIAQANFPGYRGAFLQPPLASKQDQWTTVLRVDTPETLEKWLGCEQRLKLLPEAKDFVKGTAIQNLTNSFPGWMPSDASGRQPKNWQTCMCVLLGLFPIVMLEIKFLAPQLKALNPAVANFICLTGSVFGVSYVTMPQIIKLFKWWLYQEDDAPASTMAKGIALFFGMALLEIAVFWPLLL